ncbi:hypothetical protein PM082_005421 [Marasmius tenuissimus]|nr:hypothetical protein PM082_005421 [Marasmius tenuissimus]
MKTHTGLKDQVCPESGCLFMTSDPGSLTRHRRRLHNYVPTPRRRWSDEAGAFVVEDGYETFSLASSEPDGPVATPMPSPAMGRIVSVLSEVIYGAVIIDVDSVLGYFTTTASAQLLSRERPGRSSPVFGQRTKYPSIFSRRSTAVSFNHDVEDHLGGDGYVRNHRGGSDGRPHTMQQERRVQLPFISTPDEGVSVDTIAVTTLALRTSERRSMLTSPSCQQTQMHALPIILDTFAPGAAHGGSTTETNEDHIIQEASGVASSIRGCSSIRLPSISSWFPDELWMAMHSFR